MRCEVKCAKLHHRVISDGLPVGLKQQKHAETRFLCVDEKIESLICLGFQDVVKAVWYGLTKAQ